jgi:hypothetical protein
LAPQTLSLKQVLVAARRGAETKGAIDQWIAREIIKPSMQPERGLPRQFTVTEGMQIVGMIELGRLGLPFQDAARCTQHLTAFKDSPAILVVWQGPSEIIPVTERGAPAHRALRHPDGYSIIGPKGVRSTGGLDTLIHSEIVRPAALTSMVADPDKWSLMAINLDEIEERVKAAAEDE